MNKFLRLRKWIEYDLSNKVKDKTGNDLFDWVNIIVLFGSVSFLLGFSFLLGVVDFPVFITSWVLWFTAFVVLRYTKETHHLKNVAQKQLNEMKNTQMNEFLPIIIPEEGGKLHSDGNLYLNIRNIGRGIAKDVSIQLATVTIEGNFNLEPDGPRHINVEQHQDYIKNVLSKKQEEKTIWMEIHYRDIYERKFRTVDIAFNIDEGGNYKLDRGRWKFQPL